MLFSQCHLMHFSPCGGTAAVTRDLAAGIGLPVTDHDLARTSETVQLGKTDIAIIAGPVYAGKIPANAMQALARVKGDNTPAVLIAVYGNRAYEEALFDLQAVAEKNGFVIVAAVAGIAEHSMFGKVAAGRPDAADKAELADFGKRIAAKLADGMNSLKQMPGVHIEPHVLPVEVIAPTTDLEKCTRCGKCVPVCPTHAIPPAAPNTTDLQKCMGCQACIHVCPEHARALGHPAIPAMKERLETNCADRKANELFL